MSVDIECCFCCSVSQAFLYILDACIGVEKDGAVQVPEFVWRAVRDVWVLSDDAMHPFWNSRWQHGEHSIFGWADGFPIFEDGDGFLIESNGSLGAWRFGVGSHYIAAVIIHSHGAFNAELVALEIRPFKSCELSDTYAAIGKQAEEGVHDQAIFFLAGFEEVFEVFFCPHLVFRSFLLLLWHLEFPEGVLIDDLFINSISKNGFDTCDADFDRAVVVREVVCKVCDIIWSDG